MARRFHLYVREHHTGWHTAQVLTHPEYTAYGPYASSLREEIEDVIAADIAEGRLSLHGQETWFEGLVHRAMSLELKAVQHGRLVTVPLRLGVVWYPVKGSRGTFEVRIPRIGEVFRIDGEEHVLPWAEERARGWFHLRDVRELLAVQAEKSERVEDLEIAGHAAKRRRTAAPSLPRGPDDPALEIRAPGALASLGEELVKAASDGRIGRAELRDTLVAELIGILSSRRNPSVLLVGASGSGKTVLVHELAHRIAAKSAGERLEGAAIWAVSGSRIVAGARFLGEWQERAKRVIEAVQADRAVLYAGNLLELLGASSGDRRGARTGMSIGELFRSEMTSGDLVVVAEATPDQLSMAELLEPGLVRAFRRLPVPPLPPADTETLLQRAALRLEKQRGVKWASGAVSQALDVVARFGDVESLPGSGLSLLEQMAQLAAATTKGSKAPAARIEPKDAIRAFARASGFPEPLIDPDVKLDVERVRRFFTERVVGQPRAMELMTHVIMLLKAGLNDPAKPLGSFLFMGPTGVGKTESALALAEYLFGDRKRLVRLDMSEYGDPGSALRLVDGADGQGDLTRPVREQPFAVVLLDEIEKADSGVYDLLLQLLGEGRLTDGTSRTVRFTHSIVVMTSNLGADRRAPAGYRAASTAADRALVDRKYIEAAERFFRPELVNRIDHVMPFGDLDRASLEAIARRLLDEALTREGLERRGVSVDVSPEVLARVVEQGFDPRYGARPMKRAIESLVTVPLARALAKSGAAGRLRLVLSGESVGVEAQ